MSASRTVLEAPAGVGDLLRYWRGVRRMSQLELAGEAGTTPRHVSFVETGRSQPSRQMVVRLARALDVPLRERNGLLRAAGYAPLYSAAPLDAPQLARVEAALTAMLAQHEPFPAVVLDAGWNVVRSNGAAAQLFAALAAPERLPEVPNVLRLILGPGPVRSRVRNWDTVAPGLLDRARREAVGGVTDPDTAALLDRLRAEPELAALVARPPDAAPPGGPVFDVCLDLHGTPLSFFSVVSTLGTPSDVTAQELRVEAFFPSDEATGSTWRTLREATLEPGERGENR
jgi:transcriptional regulator with XRE-family HTH domain